jgi:hypothetical protein
LEHKSNNIIFASHFNNARSQAARLKMAKLLLMKIGDGFTMSEDTLIALLEYNGIEIYAQMGQHAQKIVQLMVFHSKIGAILMEQDKLTTD